MRTASIKVTFRPPPPPDGLPNFKPRGGHTYQIRDDAGRMSVSGSFGHGPDGAPAWAWALKQARAKGFTHYTTPDHPEAREIPAE